MLIVKTYTKILGSIDGDQILKDIELAGRICYKSGNAITNESSKSFVKKIIKLGHESVLEHKTISVRIICDRGISHEIVRHRIASYSQESTRYCNYNNEVTFIDPRPYLSDQNFMIWYSAMKSCENQYRALINNGVKPQMARSILPNSLKTELIMTCNLRAWRHFFKLRMDRAAHPQMRQIAIPLLAEFQNQIPVVFDDL